MFHHLLSKSVAKVWRNLWGQTGSDSHAFSPASFTIVSTVFLESFFHLLLDEWEQNK